MWVCLSRALQGILREKNNFSSLFFLCIYEVRSIKNANLSIKYDCIKLQKFQIARKRKVLMLSFDSCIRKSAETKTQSVADN